MYGCGCHGHGHCHCWPRGFWCSCCGCWHYGNHVCCRVVVVPPVAVTPVSQPRPAVTLGQAIRQGRAALGA